MRESRALAKARLADSEESTGRLSLPPLGLRFQWTDPTGDVDEALQRTQDEFAVRIGILREAIGAIRALAHDVHAKQDALTDVLHGPAPDPAAVDALRRAIDERRERIDRLARAAVNRLRREPRAKRA